MKIAIHHREGSFSDRWTTYCQEKGIEYKLVNAYDSDIVQQVEGCDAFMWHFHQSDYRDMQFAKALILSLEAKGIRCFPDSKTCWHFDNKVWEKYLLEAIGAPLVPSYVFYTKTEALRWARSTCFPKVFKLKGGASASNVRLAHTRKEAVKLIDQCFGRGIRHYRWKERFKESLRKYKEGKASLHELLRPFKYALKRYPTQFDHYHGREMGYAYFQDFIPNNTFDMRVWVVGDKAFGIKRPVREGDFRASGGGNRIYDYRQFDERCARIAFEVSKKLETQSLTFDFVFDPDNQPLIVEISYGTPVEGYDPCEGYWSDDLVWHAGVHPEFCGCMVEDLIRQ